MPSDVGLVKRLCLASASPRRAALLAQIGFSDIDIFPTNIDETPGLREIPSALAARLAFEKSKSADATMEQDANRIILAADTVVAVGRRILPKAENETEAMSCLKILSGRSHRVYTGVCVVSAGKTRSRLVETRIRFKRLGDDDISMYLNSGEWQGKAGGYAIQGLAGCFVSQLTGSYSNVVGLPLYETMNLLKGHGLAPRLS